MSEHAQIVARCTRCYSEFTEAQIEGAAGCPKCGTLGIPMHPREDALVRVNVHELRVLCIWAENYAVHVDNQNLDNAKHESMKETVNLIASRLRSQLRTQGLDKALTLSAEIKELETMAGERGGTVEFHRDGREEIP